MDYYNGLWRSTKTESFSVTFVFFSLCWYAFSAVSYQAGVSTFIVLFEKCNLTQIYTLLEKEMYTVLNDRTHGRMFEKYQLLS